MIDETTAHTSSVYGPVHSWRVGSSLGIDLLLQNSICSFNCIYCQLGDIQVKTSERKIYVTTDQVERDLKESAWEKSDIITLSGSGEPTLALNLGEVIHMIKEYTQKPVMVLTNGTLLRDPAVQNDLLQADQIAVKLDAASEDGLKRMNRPVAGISLDTIVEGAVALRQRFTGKMSLQCMFMPANVTEADKLADLILKIKPDEVQLNTPKRPYPLQWVLDSRGNHSAVEYPSTQLKVLSQDQAAAIESILKQKTGIPIVSVYQKTSI
ncbi:MAG: radical SAM protein [Cyanobacteria bacterium]|nr:radical SAM protein [Cyanobacteriota bacterium]